jgi:hypothetical protein
MSLFRRFIPPKCSKKFKNQQFQSDGSIARDSGAEWMLLLDVFRRATVPAMSGFRRRRGRSPSVKTGCSTRQLGDPLHEKEVSRAVRSAFTSVGRINHNRVKARPDARRVDR